MEGLTYMDNLKMAELLFGSVDKTPEDFEAMYPQRQLPEGARVTRFAPSPTGFLHFGSLFAAFIAAKTAGKDGVFYLRIEDTDKKREGENGVIGMVNGIGISAASNNRINNLTREGAAKKAHIGRIDGTMQDTRNIVAEIYADKLATQRITIAMLEENLLANIIATTIEIHSYVLAIECK